MIPVVGSRWAVTPDAKTEPTRVYAHGWSDGQRNADPNIKENPYAT